MKKLNLLLLILLFPAITIAQQNLVPNPSFEDTVACPTSLSGQFGDQIYNLTDWFPALNSPDYYNSCASYSSDVSTPLNGLGDQIPNDGNAYIGIITYGYLNPDYREVVGVKLKSYLQTGKSYHISFYAASTCGINHAFYSAANNLGGKFSNIKYDAISNPIVINNDPSVFDTTLISDTLNWTKLSFKFTADSSYQYFYIGNFWDHLNTDTTICINSASLGAYYFIDNVRISTDSLTGFDESDMDKSILLYPNPFSKNLYLKSTFNIKEFTLFDIYGRLIGYIDFKRDKDKYIFDISDTLKDGIYILKFNTLQSSYSFILKKT